MLRLIEEGGPGQHREQHPGGQQPHNRVRTWAEESALEAVRKFTDTVNGVFPERTEDGPRWQIIDSVFKMMEQLVEASTRLAQEIVKTTNDVLTQGNDKAGSST